VEYKKAYVFRNKMDESEQCRHIQYKIPKTNEELVAFDQYYLLLRWELDKMKEILQEKRVEFENKCDHDWVKDWDNRDERSRWKCTKCTKFR